MQIFCKVIKCHIKFLGYPNIKCWEYSIIFFFFSKEIKSNRQYFVAYFGLLGKFHRMKFVQCFG